jgi:hypothetical protein
MSFDKPPVNKVEQKKTPEEREQLYKILLEELKVECPTLGSFYKLINEQKNQGKTQPLGATPNPIYLSRSFSGILLSIQEILERPNNDGDTISIPVEKYQTIQNLKQSVDAMAAAVYFGQSNPINENGKIEYLLTSFANRFSKELKY